MPSLNDAQNEVLRHEFAKAPLGDDRSTGACQCARMPGSKNPKNGHPVEKVYSAPNARSSRAPLKANKPELRHSASPVGSLKTDESNKEAPQKADL